MICFTCPKCEAEFTVGPEKAGKIVKCSMCQSQFKIPGPEKISASRKAIADPDAPVEVAPCPYCQAALLVATRHLGQSVECPTCQKAFTAKMPLPTNAADQANISSMEPNRVDGERPSRRKSEPVSDDEQRPSKRNRISEDEEEDEDEDYRPRSKKKRRRRSHVESKRILAGVLALVLGGFGAHKFVLGYSNSAVIMLVTSLVGIMGFFGGICCYLPFVLCLGNLVMTIIGIIEGIVYLTKSDAEFIEIYQFDQKEWF